jgi:hypothetical protein
MTIAPVDVKDARGEAESAGSSSEAAETVRPGAAQSAESSSERLAMNLGVAILYGAVFGIICWNAWRMISAITK